MKPLTLLIPTLTPLLAWSLPSNPGQTQQQCKPLPGDPSWPSLSAWATLNNTLNGSLIAPPPPGAVCYPDHELFNNASCNELQKNWILSSWHAQNPITSDYNDYTCVPYPELGFNCSRAGYPAYTLNATTHEQVAAAVKFATDTGVRLVIKGTGHDFPGRSAGRGSLSIHTHNLRGVEVDHGDARAVKYGGVASVKIAAGMRMFELYERMAAENLTLVAGADPDVGIGGWTGGGGHAPVSAMFGMGADNVLEMEVVTADGQIRTLNGDCEDKDEQDLFWALRGGGPSTYAVMLSVTMIAYPPVNLTTYIFFYNTTAISSSFWNMTALFHQHLPQISQSGGMGYYYTLPNLTVLAAEIGDSGMQLPFNVSLVPPSQQGLIFGTFLFNSTTGEDATKAMAPVEAALRSLSATQPDPIHAAGFAIPPTVPFSAMWAATSPQTVGSTNTRLGSWLLGSEGLSRPLAEMASAFAAASGQEAFLPQLGHLVSGPGVHRHLTNPGATLPGGGDALLPAWRTAYTHVVLPGSWSGVADKEVLTQELQERVDAISQLEPGSGAYMNEADPTNEAWKGDYFGDGPERYGRLLGVKERWDPSGVFWCRSCVGSDLWTWAEGEGVVGGQGVGQDVGRWCWGGD